jgi:cation transport ATPase
MHTAICSVSPYYGHAKASNQKFKSVSVSAITVLAIYHSHSSIMDFVHWNTRSLMDQVKSSFWLVWLAYQGLRAIDERANFSTDTLVVLVAEGSVYIIFWGHIMVKCFTRTIFFEKYFFLLLSFSIQKFLYIGSEEHTEYCINLSTILKSLIQKIKVNWAQKCTQFSDLTALIS